MEKSDKVLLLSSIVVVGFALGIMYHYVLGFYLGLDQPFNSFLAGPKDFMCDFYRILPFIKGFAPYTTQGNWQQYFPLAYLILAPFSYIANITVSYLLFISIFLSGFVYWNIRAFHCENLDKVSNFQNIFIMTVLTYPLLFLIDRGNFDMIIFVFFALFIFMFQKEKYKTAAVFLGLINAMKPFSLLFLFIFLFKKKYKEFFISIATTVLFIIGGFMIFKGNMLVQIPVMYKSILWFKDIYAIQNGNNFGMGHGSSFFMVLKLLFCKSTAVALISTQLLDKFYNYFSLAVTAITIFFVYKERIFWKQTTLLTCNMLFLPYFMEDYKLIFLFVPIWLFVTAKEKSKFDLAYVILFALLLIPKNFIFIFPEVSPTAAQWFSLSMVLNPLVMMFLSGLIIYEQFVVKAKIK